MDIIPMWGLIKRSIQGNLQKTMFTTKWEQLSIVILGPEILIDPHVYKCPPKGSPRTDLRIKTGKPFSSCQTRWPGPFWHGIRRVRVVTLRRAPVAAATAQCADVFGREVSTLEVGSAELSGAIQMENCKGVVRSGS